MSDGFRKGKLPKRFDEATYEAISNLPITTYFKMIEAEAEADIVHKVNCYYDTDLAAAQIIKRIERLEKALDKACETLEFLTSDSDKSMTSEQYKAVLMNNEDK